MSTDPNVGVLHTVFLWVSMSSTLNFRLATKRFSHRKKTSNFLKQQSTPRDKCTYLKVIQANGALWTFLADTASFPKPPLHSDTKIHAEKTRSPGIRRNVVASDLRFGKQPFQTAGVGLIGSKSWKPTKPASHGSHGTFTLGRFRRVEAEAPSLGFSAQGFAEKTMKGQEVNCNCTSIWSIYFSIITFIYIYISCLCHIPNASRHLPYHSNFTSLVYVHAKTQVIYNETSWLPAGSLKLPRLPGASFFPGSPLQSPQARSVCVKRKYQVDTDTCVDWKGLHRMVAYVST